MLNSAYIWWMVGSALLAAGVHFFLTKGLKNRALLTGLTLVLGALLGAVCAKALYCATQWMHFQDQIQNYGLGGAIFSDNLTAVSYYGGVLGVILAAALAGKATGNGAVKALNAYAPAGALMAALARFGEGFLEMMDLGALQKDEWTHFFPLTAKYEWSPAYAEWYLAVFMLSGIAYLIVCGLSLLFFREKRFVRTLYYMCLPQILLESLRIDSSMKFHEFVKVEQLLCMIGMVVILILYGVWAGKKQKNRCLPALLSLVCAGVFVAVEFALDGKLGENLRYGIPYVVMGLGMIALAVLECWGFSRVRTEKKV